MERYFRILDCESVKDFALEFENNVYKFIGYKNGYIALDTDDGELLFTQDEVEEVII